MDVRFFDEVVEGRERLPNAFPEVVLDGPQGEVRAGNVEDCL